MDAVGWIASRPSGGVRPGLSGADGAKTSDPRAEALRLYMSGLNLEQVASKLDTTVRIVRQLLAGTPKRPPGPGRRTDVSDERVLERREMHRMTWEQIGDTVGLTTPGAKSRYVAAFTRRGDPSKAAQKAALDKVAERLRRRDIAQQRLVTSVREALAIDVSLSSLAEALNIDEDQVRRLAEPIQDPNIDQEAD